MIFSDTLAVAGDLLTAGTPVIVSVEAERDGDTLKMRAQSIEALDKAAANIRRDFRLVLDADIVAARRAGLDAARARLKPAGQRGGEVRLVLPIEELGREMEIVLPGRYDVSPQEAGQLSAIPGVVEVLEI